MYTMADIQRLRETKKAQKKHQVTAKEFYDKLNKVRAIRQPYELRVEMASMYMPRI